MKKDERERRRRSRFPGAAASTLASTILSLMSAGAGASLGTSASAVAQTPPLAAQEVVALKGGTIHVGNGDVIEGGTVLVKGARIEAVGKTIAIPEGAHVVDVTGRHVYPGLIDAESGVLLDSDSSGTGEGQPATSVVDAIDPFQKDERALALAGGVTTIYVAPHRGLLDGGGAVLKLRPARAADELVLKRDFAITATFGANVDRPTTRLREWKMLLDRLAATKKYIEAWDDYDEKLAEYKKELEKAKKEGNTKAEKKEEGPKPPTPPEPKPDERPPGPDGPGPGGRPRGRRRPPSGSLLPYLFPVGEGAPLHVDGDDPDGDPHDCTKEPIGLSWKDGVSYAEEGAPAAGGEKKEDAKKPPRPGRDVQSEALRRLLEGKLSLRVQASHSADLQNLLDLRQQYPIDVVVTGGADAWKLASALANANVPVVFALAADAAPEVAAVPAKLAAAHVDFALTADDPGSASTRFLALVAAVAVAGGLDREAALAAITSTPARQLGVDDRVGTLEAGKDADVVVTRGELFSSSVVFEQVYVDGKPVLAR
jgi:imidazolonepropionase-like amidohydrolase